VVDIADEEPPTADNALGHRTARGVPWVAASAIVGRALLAAVVLVLAANLSVHDLGLIAVPVTLSTVLTTLNDAGFGQAIVVQRRRLLEATETAVFMSVLIGILMATAVLLSADVAASFFHVPAAAPLIRVYAVLIALDAYVTVPIMRLNRDLAFRRRFVIDTLPQAFGAIATIVLAVRGAGVWSLPLGDALRFVLVFGIVIATPGLRSIPRWHAGAARGMWRFASGATVALAFDILVLNVDYVLVGRLLGPTALGYYSLAFRIAIIPFFIATMVVIGSVWPALARIRDVANLEGAFRMTTRLGMTAVLILGGGVFVTAPWIEVLGARWTATVPIVRLLAIFVVLRSLAYLVEAYFQATRRPGTNAILRAAWFVVLTAAIAAASSRGLVAVAWAQVAVGGTLVAAHLVSLGRRHEIAVLAVLRDLVGPVAAIAAVCVLMTTGERLFVGESDSVAALVLFGVVYVAAAAGAIAYFAPSIVRDARGFAARWARPFAGHGSRERAGAPVEDPVSPDKVKGGKYA
jgi:O-antigen/teichoic acid export membrane protein